MCAPGALAFLVPLWPEGWCEAPGCRLRGIQHAPVANEVPLLWRGARQGGVVFVLKRASVSAALRRDESEQ